MSECQLQQRGIKTSVPSPLTAQPREGKVSGTITTERPECKKIFLIRDYQGKRHKINSPLIRITPDPLGYCLVEAFEGGVWSPIMTTPKYFDLTTEEQ